MNKCTVCGEKFEENVCPHCGKNGNVVKIIKMSYPSEFDGGAIVNGLMNLAVFFASLFTLSIAYPFMICWKLRWECSHTYINGRRLMFDGTGVQLIGKYIVWYLLSVITFGIYFIVAGELNIVRWQTKHTHFEGLDSKEEEDEKSIFTGHWYQLFGINFVANLVTVVTLGFGAFWARCYKERWYASHTLIDGHPLFFTGKALDYFKECFMWAVFTVFTLGIYAFWLSVNCLKWVTEHTRVELDKSLPAPVLEGIIRN